MPAAIGVVGPRRCLHSSACMRSLRKSQRQNARRGAWGMKHRDNTTCLPALASYKGILIKIEVNS